MSHAWPQKALLRQRVLVDDDGDMLQVAERIASAVSGKFNQKLDKSSRQWESNGCLIGPEWSSTRNLTLVTIENHGTPSKVINSFFSILHFGETMK